ncbi:MULTISPECIES: IS4 family transposase [Micromonospora]|uniref:IS4 family transposase n=1 Tax=Micromonospora sicca TaxID=2202420 RepID=A0A317DQV5_9ACTN|nr:MULTISPECIES: IS4 family transposase [unclassified Micromonospora]MBM0230300.1 IS4 family transposase [Micromonospora sp. ATA51]PWR16734.1 IS4 family transposase [Micromonospora sp. 4G51]
MAADVVGRPGVRPDQVTLGVLISQVPRDAVDEAVAVCGVREKRSDGKLPAHVTAYLTLGLALFPEDDYTEVATRVTGSLDRFGCWDAGWSVPTSSAITQARKRLGRAVFSELFENTCGPVAGRVGPTSAVTALGTARGSFLRSWRLLAIDGFEVDVPDSDDNAAEFGYAGSGENRSAFPKARVVALAECGTHAFVAAEIGGYATGEKTLAARLYPRLRPDELLTADRGFYSWTAWDTAQATGAALVWRAPTQLDLPVVRVLPDGTYLTVLIKPTIRGGRRERLLAAARAGQDLDDINAVPDAFDDRGLPVVHLARVIEYDVPDREGNGTGELIVLLSTITSPGQARADELAAAYHQRWEQETGHDQLKTHLRGPGRILRSKLPDLVYQEIWAYLIIHHAISALTAQASAAADLDPDRISFTKALRLVRRTATGTADIPPSGLG